MEQEKRREGQRENSLGFELKCINNLIRRNLDMRFIEAGLGDLSGMQGPMLGYIREASNVRDVYQKDLEKQFNVRRSTATVILQNLEQKGYIVRGSVKSDGRVKKITVTEKAVQHDTAIHHLIDGFNKELEEGITPEEKECFYKILEKIRSNLETENRE